MRWRIYMCVCVCVCVFTKRPLRLYANSFPDPFLFKESKRKKAEAEWQRMHRLQLVRPIGCRSSYGIAKKKVFVKPETCPMALTRCSCYVWKVRGCSAFHQIARILHVMEGVCDYLTTREVVVFYQAIHVMEWSFCEKSLQSYCLGRLDGTFKFACVCACVCVCVCACVCVCVNA